MSEFLSSIDGGTDLLMRFRYEMPVDLHDETHEMDQNRKMKQLAIESCKTQNPFILEIVEIYKSLGKDIFQQFLK